MAPKHVFSLDPLTGVHPLNTGTQDVSRMLRGVDNDPRISYSYPLQAENAPVLHWGEVREDQALWDLLLLMASPGQQFSLFYRGA